MKYIFIHIILLFPFAVLGQSFTGGAGSGADMSVYLAPTNYYKGGESDGFSFDKYFTNNNYFKGGEGDGYVKGDYLYYHLWTGEISSAWDDAQNWSLNIIPDVNTRAQIPVVSMGQFYPTLTTGTFKIGERIVGPNYLCRALWVHPNAKMTQGIGVVAENHSEMLIEGAYSIPSLSLSPFTNKPGSKLLIHGNGTFEAGN